MWIGFFYGDLGPDELVREGDRDAALLVREASGWNSFFHPLASALNGRPRDATEKTMSTLPLGPHQKLMVLVTRSATAKPLLRNVPVVWVNSVESRFFVEAGGTGIRGGGVP